MQCFLSYHQTKWMISCFDASKLNYRNQTLLKIKTVKSSFIAELFINFAVTTNINEMA